MPDEHKDNWLLPRRVIFADPEKRLVRLSPDGKWIAFQAPLAGILNIWVAPIDALDEARPVTVVKDRNLGPMLMWMHDGHHILFCRDQAGDENWCIWRVDVRTTETLPLTPTSGVHAYIQQLSRHFPGELLIAHNQRDKRYFDIYRITAETGASELVHTNEGFSSFYTDQQFRVRYAVRSTDEGDREYLKKSEAGSWDHFATVDADDALSTNPVAFSDDGNTLFWLDSRGRDRAAVAAQDQSADQISILLEDSKSDFTTLLLDPVTHTPIAAACAFKRRTWHVLDQQYEEDFQYLSSVSSGDLFVNNMSDDRMGMIVGYIADNRPIKYFHYDRKLKKARRLFSSAPALKSAPLVNMQPVTVRARDGLELVCYLSQPRKSSIKSKRPSPIVLLVHGGPYARDFWGLDPNHQWLANRGYAVLSVNYRGSLGFGKSFVNAANMEWAGKMHDDLIDAVDWPIAEGIADPKRIAIMGASYGGYAALVGLTFTPEKFACAIDLCGISNLVTLMDTIPDYWKAWQSLWKVRMGDYTTEEGRRFLETRSPLSHVDNIVRPLLIGQGVNDVRVKPSEAEQIVAAMQARDIPVTYVSYSDEGHGLGRAPNRLSFAAVTEAFLAAHLGGRLEPVGDDFQDSTIDFKLGRELIPGL